eukprot:scaffold61979_cov18-Tisochrysis_lutea.AAC.1
MQLRTVVAKSKARWRHQAHAAAHRGGKVKGVLEASTHRVHEAAHLGGVVEGALEAVLRDVLQQHQDGLHLFVKLLVDLKCLLCQPMLNRLHGNRRNEMAELHDGLQHIYSTQTHKGPHQPSHAQSPASQPQKQACQTTCQAPHQTGHVQLPALQPHCLSSTCAWLHVSDFTYIPLSHEGLKDTRGPHLSGLARVGIPSTCRKPSRQGTVAPVEHVPKQYTAKCVLRTFSATAVPSKLSSLWMSTLTRPWSACVNPEGCAGCCRQSELIHLEAHSSNNSWPLHAVTVWRLFGTRAWTERMYELTNCHTPVSPPAPLWACAGGVAVRCFCCIQGTILPEAPGASCQIVMVMMMAQQTFLLRPRHTPSATCQRNDWSQECTRNIWLPLPLPSPLATGGAEQSKCTRSAIS